jgi:inhibitor of the pro-sigma K processing machinery
MEVTMDLKMLVVYVACIIGIFIIGKIFIIPIKLIVKLMINSILGGILLYVINIVGSMWQFHIGINLITSLMVGILGVPGAILLILIKIFIL